MVVSQENVDPLGWYLKGSQQEANHLKGSESVLFIGESLPFGDLGFITFNPFPPKKTYILQWMDEVHYFAPNFRSLGF